MTISQAKTPVERFFLAAGELGPIHSLLHRASALSHSWTQLWAVAFSRMKMLFSCPALL
jgi:hypothetical protein